MSALIDNLIFFIFLRQGGLPCVQSVDQRTRVNQDSIYVVNRTRDAPAFSKLSQKGKNQPFGRTLRLWNTQGFQETLDMFMPRDPFDRVLSAYHYSKSFDRSDAFEVIQENNMDVVEFAEQYGGSWLINGQIC